MNSFGVFLSRSLSHLYILCDSRPTKAPYTTLMGRPTSASLVMRAPTTTALLLAMFFVAMPPPVVMSLRAGVPFSERARSMLPTSSSGGGTNGLIGMAFEGISLDEYVTTRLGGRVPGSMTTFTPFPVPESNWQWLDMFMRDCARRGMVCVITLEPFDGLDAVTSQACRAIVDRVVRWERHAAGAKVILRFAHEMNGGWYVWGQQPALYREKFRLLANMVHQYTCRATMMWSPNTGCGYPFAHGHPYSRCTRSSLSADDRAECDANGDGVVDEGDAYIPYYPGNNYVDWVGLSVYYMADNALAPANRFTGIQPDGTLTCRSNVAAFYRLFSSSNAWHMSGDAALMDATAAYARKVGANQPPRKYMAIGETAARFVECDTAPWTTMCQAYRGTPTELAIKTSWWSQLFGTNTISAFPRLKLIHWFDIRKAREYQGNTVDWTVTRDQSIRTAFLNFFSTPAGGSGYWRFTSASNADADNNVCTDYVSGASVLPSPLPWAVTMASPIYQWYQLRPWHVPGRTKCVTSNTRGALIQFACDASRTSDRARTQRFRLRTIVNNSTHNIVSFVDPNGRCVRIPDRNMTNGAQFHVGECMNTANEHFRITVANFNAYVITAVHSRRGADVPRSSVDDGAPIVQFTVYRSNNQVFEFRRLPTLYQIS